MPLLPAGAMPPALPPHPASQEQQEAGAALDAGMCGVMPCYDGLDELGGGYDPGRLDNSGRLTASLRYAQRS